MALEIPKRYASAIALIVRLPRALFDELVRRLEAAPVIPEPDDMASQLGEIPDLSQDDLRTIVNVIYALYRVREFSELGHQSFLNELVKGVQEPINPITKEEVREIRERFKRLLGIASLNSVGKALGLQRDGERLYCSAKIISDIRPVFGDDVESEPVGAVITHTLKLGYHEQADHKEFFVVLDQEDLVKLFDVLERAMTKGTSLQELLKRAEVPRLGI